MKLINQGLVCLSIGVALMASSCANESPWDNGIDQAEGRIDLNLLTDSSVQLGSRADENPDASAMKVDTSLFSISLKSNDGSYNRTWDSLEAFGKTTGFPQGRYKLSAYYGSIETEGFNSPYYYGETDVTVRLGETSAPTVTAYLGNAMVSVRYTEDFASMYTRGYSAEVQAPGHQAVAFVNGENRPAYLAPGFAQLYINLTNSAGVTVKVNPTSLNLSARHHYIVTVGVNLNDQGKKILDIQVTEDITEEDPIEINLSDDLFTTLAPEVIAKGFETGTPIEFWQTMLAEDLNPELHVMALAGIASATLTLTAENGGVLPGNASDTYTVELVNASTSDKAILETAKLKCYGFYENGSEFGVVSFGEYLKNLPQGDYTASLIVKDKMGRSSAVTEDLQILTTKVKGIEYEFDSYKKPKFMDNQIEITLKSNCDELEADKFNFHSSDSNRGLSPVKGSLSGKPTDNSDGYYYYTFILTTDDINDNTWTVQSQYGNLKQLTNELEVELPEFTVLTDPFAMQVKIKFVNEDPAVATLVAQHINIDNGKSTVMSTNIDRSQAADGIIIVKGLSPSTDYSGWKSYLGSKTTATYSGNPIDSFRTEENKDVPNEKFSILGELTSIPDIQVGSPYHVSVMGIGTDYKTPSSISRYAPEGWATLNSYTCYDKSSNINTWYLVPSTFVEDHIVTIRSVGFNHNGEDLAPSYGNANSSGNMNTHYYGETLPKELEKKSGELFLGKYEYNGMENEVEERGIEFSSRPLYLSFDYSYMSYDNMDTGLAYIKVLGKDNTILAENSADLNSTQSWSLNNKNLPSVSDPGSHISIPLDYVIFGSTAEKIEISFKSSKGEVTTLYIPSGNVLDEGLEAGGDNGYRNGSKKKREANSYHAFAMSSELKISNVVLSYK